MNYMLTTVASSRRLLAPHTAFSRSFCCKSIPVHVVQTSLGGMGEKRELLRHLGLRFGDTVGDLQSESKDFKEAHFGPDEGSFQEGFLKFGDGMVADSKYLEITPADGRVQRRDDRQHVARDIIFEFDTSDGTLEYVPCQLNGYANDFLDRKSPSLSCDSVKGSFGSWSTRQLEHEYKTVCKLFSSPEGVACTGSTNKTPEECVEWCRSWADGRLFVGVGQNCWTMVGDFLKEDPDCFLPEAVKFKEQQVNGVTKILVDAAQKRADEEGVEIGAVMQEIMENPRELVPELVHQMSADMLDKLEMPDQLEQIVKEGQLLKEKMTAAADGEGILPKFKEHIQEKVEEYTSDNA